MGDGTFTCPEEGGDRPYRLMLARRWFYVAFVPVVPMDVLGEYVECASCGEPFERSVLDLPTTTEQRDALRTVLRHAMVAIIRADERVTNHERHVALDIMANFGLDDYALIDLERDLAALEVEDLDGKAAMAGSMLTATGQERVVRACIQLAAADGAVSQVDLDLIATVGRSMGMLPARIKAMLDEVEPGY
ncbi:MAG: TerB family tellurite resistance protein [Acidimicrobiia bacterium]|nr:TerB family tellurite resistance protein [Acidimicrobiia bacterium]